MLPKIFKGIYHFTVYAIGFLVLTAAVVVTLIRLFLPDIGIYRGEVEAWVGRYMGYPVAIHSLDATWEGWVPHLQLGDIDLLNKAGTQAITHFDSAQIRIAPLATLIKRRIVPKQLTIIGFEVAVARLSNGAIYIEGINVSNPQMPQLGDNELAEWLFKQEQIKIQNGTIEWLDIKHQQKPILLSNVNLILRSDGQRLQVDGSAKLPEQYGNNMDFSFDAYGDLLSSEWSGELYLTGRDIKPDNWYKDYRPLNFNISGGNANIKVWSRWQDATLSGLEGELEYNDFDTRAGDNELHVRELAYRFEGERIDTDGWQVQLNLNHLLTDNGDWPKTNITISGTRKTPSEGYRYSASFNYLKLDDLSPFISNLMFIPDSVKDKLAEASIQGHLKQGKIIYDPNKEPTRRLHFDTKFEEINTKSSPQFPSLSSLSGHIFGYPNQGTVSLDTFDIEIEFDLKEKKSIQLNRVVGSVNWLKIENDWKIVSPELHIQSKDISANLRGTVKLFADEPSPFLDLLVNIDETELINIPDYLPRTEKFKFRDWMKRSVLGGQLSSASALFRGRISDFPFDKKNGRFQLIANTENSTLDYSAIWPPVDNIDAEVIIDGREMHANIRHGEIFDAEITNADANIANILTRQKTLDIKGHIRGSTKSLSLFIVQSPLHKDPGLNEISRSLQSGDISLNLDLSIPLKQPGKTVGVIGNIALANSVVKSPIKNLQLDDVTGNINFTRHSLSSEIMNATFVENPVTLTISGNKTDPTNLPGIRISGMADEQFVADRLLEYFPALESLENYFRNRMIGEAEWSITMTNLPVGKGEPVVKKLEIESNLVGMKIDFPAPVGKPEHHYQPLKVVSYLGAVNNRDVQIEYSDIFNAELQINSDKKLHSINLHVGEGQIPDNSEPGLFISGDADSLVATQWWNVIKERVVDKTRPSNAVLKSGVHMDLQVGSLELLNHQFPEVSLKIRRPEQNWQFHLQGEDISGDINIPIDLSNNNVISFQLDKLNMNETQRKPGPVNTNKLDPKDIPAISGTVTDFIYNNFELGKMELDTLPITKGLSIEKIAFSNPKLNIIGSGDWTGKETIDSSSFEMELHAENMETMLTTFNYNQTPVKKGETNLYLKADWQGTPMDFSLEGMNGSLKMQIGKGHMLDVDPLAGRLFGLFSLHTLSRRLTLDFSDIFGKGLAFDKIEGSFSIDNGNAYTNDLYMHGPAANVSISGRTGLSEQNYDQVVTVTPQFSDNLPVAGVLLGPVGIGIGAVFYLAEQMFDSVHDSINKLLRYQYTITGSWNEPVIEKIKKKNDQQLSEAVRMTSQP